MQVNTYVTCRFCKGWDSKLVAMYQALTRCVPKPVISHYPPHVDQACCRLCLWLR